MLRSATLRAHDPNSIGYRPYESLVLRKPFLTVSVQQAPCTMGENGTWLMPLPEGVSPQVSPPENITEYHVNESRKYYGEIVTARTQRRKSRAFLKQGEVSQQLQQGQAIRLSSRRETEWPDVDLTYSSPEENGDIIELDAPLTPHHIDSPPSAPEISPTIPSPQEISSPLSSPPSRLLTPETTLPSSPPIGANLSPVAATSSTLSTPTAPHTSTPVGAALRAASPIASSLSAEKLASSPPKKRGRPHKAIAEPHTPSGRKSGRSNKFTGPCYTK